MEYFLQGKMTNAEWLENISEEEAMTWGQETLLALIGGYCEFGYLDPYGRPVFYKAWLDKEHEEAEGKYHAQEQNP